MIRENSYCISQHDYNYVPIKFKTKFVPNFKPKPTLQPTFRFMGFFLTGWKDHVAVMYAHLIIWFEDWKLEEDKAACEKDKETFECIYKSIKELQEDKKISPRIM